MVSLDDIDVWRSDIGARARKGDPRVKDEIAQIAFDDNADEKMRHEAVRFYIAFYDDRDEKFREMLDNREAPRQVRQAIIYSMYRDGRLFDANQLLPIWKDRLEHHEIRISAFENLLQRDPNLYGEVLDVVTNPEENIEVRLWSIGQLKPMSDEKAFEALKKLTADTNLPVDLRERAFRAYSDTQSVGVRELAEFAKTTDHRWLAKSAMRVISSRDSDEACETLIEYATDPDLDFDLRHEATLELGTFVDNPDARDVLTTYLAKEGFIEGTPYLRFAGVTDWKDVVAEVVSAFDKAGTTRARADTAGAHYLISSAFQGKRHALPGLGRRTDGTELSDALISAAVKARGRLNEIIADVLVHHHGRDRTQTARRIVEYQESRDVSADELEELRVNVGGAEALSPVVEILRNNLEKRFEAPIGDLNDDTMRMWQDTIASAQFGFRTRMWMSVVIFLIGCLITLASATRMLFAGTLGVEVETLGLFATGLGTMLVVVYRGPLREIRQSVNDLGVASAAYIAYVHRVLQISHTFSFYYLKESISFDEMQRSSSLIDEAMNGTIKSLTQTSGISAESKNSE